MALFEIVPNLSEGKDSRVIDAAVAAVEAAGARVLHRTSDEIHHRTVLTIVGNDHAVVDAAVALAGVAVQHIDLRKHSGVHPRIGALDVLPFVPLEGANLDQAVTLAVQAAERIWQAYRVPSFFYEAAARSPQRKLLASVRAHPANPDVGEVDAHVSAGAIAIGARNILIALNVDLDTADLSVATAIAKELREKTGGLCSLRALGFALGSRAVQVSMNVTDHEATPLYRVVELVRALATGARVTVLRTELIGCLPRAAVENTARFYLGI